MSNALVLKGVDFSANKLETVTIYSSKPCTGFTLSQHSIQCHSEDPITLSYSISPLDCTDPIVWSSSDTSVARISNGIITIVGIGTATITATCGMISDTCTITISDVIIDSGFIAAVVSNADGKDFASIEYNNRRLSYVDVIDSTSTRLKLNRNGSAPYAAPHKLITGTTKVRFKADNNVNAEYSAYLFFFDDTRSSSISGVIAYMVEKNIISASNSSFDQTFDVPESANSFVAMVNTKTIFQEGDDLDEIAAEMGVQVIMM